MSAECRVRRAECRTTEYEFRVPNSLLRTPHSALRTRRRGDGGQALVEYAIVFPLQLMLTLAIIQLALIFVAQQVVDYAAYCGARAKLVGLSLDEQHRAVVIPLSGICGADTDKDAASGIPNPFDYNNPLRGSGTAMDPSVTPVWDVDVGEYKLPGKGCTVMHNYQLRIPGVNMLLYGMSFGPKGIQKDPTGTICGGEPYVTLTGKCLLAQPWPD